MNRPIVPILGKAVVIGGVIALLAVAGFVYLGDKKDDSIIAKKAVNFLDLEIEGAKVRAEIADTDPLREVGLGGRDSIKDGEGMWFVFDIDDDYQFWMKDMRFAIDIIWFDKDLKIVGVKDNAQPDSYSEINPEIFTAGALSRFALEVPAGFTEKHQIKIGDQAKIVF